MRSQDRFPCKACAAISSVLRGDLIIFLYLHFKMSLTLMGNSLTVLDWRKEKWVIGKQLILQNSDF